jgi:hypothetical protein
MCASDLDVILEVVGICLSFVLDIGKMDIRGAADGFYGLSHDGSFSGDGFELCIGIDAGEFCDRFIV